MAKTGKEHFGEPEKPKITFFWVIIIGILQTIATVGFNREGLYVFLGSLVFGLTIAFYFEYLS